MSLNHTLPLASVGLATAQRAGRDAALAHSTKTSKSAHGPAFIRTWQNYLVSLWMQYLVWQARRSARTLLHSLDDRTLRDIGLSRNEIETAVRDIRWPLRPRHA